MTPTLVPGSGNSVFDEDTLFEAELDLEWSGAVAPAANIPYFYTGDNQAAGGAFDAISYVLDEAPTPIMSASFSACENPALDGITATVLADELLELGDQANLEGVTFVAASGDTGPASCDPNDGEASATGGEWVGFPASMPGVTGIGGTSVTNADAAWSHTNDTNHGSVILPIAVDTVWDDTFADPSAPSIGAGGGGQSALFPKPIWQRGPGVPSASHRYVPDVALSAGGAPCRTSSYSATPPLTAPTRPLLFRKVCTASVGRRPRRRRSPASLRS